MSDFYKLSPSLSKIKFCLFVQINMKYFEKWIVLSQQSFHNIYNSDSSNALFVTCYMVHSSETFNVNTYFKQQYCFNQNFLTFAILSLNRHHGPSKYSFEAN